jgi:gas vesicle protein
MTTATSTRESLSAEIRALVDRLAQSDLPEQVAHRGRDLAEVLSDVAEESANRAGEAWRESAPMRKEAEKAARAYGREAARWSGRTWRTAIRPRVRDLWRRRVVAYSAAGAAVPVGKELLSEATKGIGRGREPDRHWGAFFFGLLLGAVAGAAAALLTAPQTGQATRSTLAEKAREATMSVDDWRSVFQRSAEEASETIAPVTKAPRAPKASEAN